MTGVRASVCVCETRTWLGPQGPHARGVATTTTTHRGLPRCCRHSPRYRYRFCICICICTPPERQPEERRRRGHVRATSLLLHSLEATSKGLLLLTPRAAGDDAAAADGPGGRPRPREAHHRAAGRVCAHAAEREAPGSARALAVRRGHPAAVCVAAREPLVGQVQLHQLCAGPVRLSILRSLRRGPPGRRSNQSSRTHTAAAGPCRRLASRPPTTASL